MVPLGWRLYVWTFRLFPAVLIQSLIGPYLFFFPGAELIAVIVQNFPDVLMTNSLGPMTAPCHRIVALTRQTDNVGL